MIDNSYAEHLVKRKQPAYWLAVKAGMILLFILSLLPMARIPFGFVLPVAAAAGIYLVFLNGDIEYCLLYTSSGDRGSARRPGEGETLRGHFPDPSDAHPAAGFRALLQ